MSFGSLGVASSSLLAQQRVLDVIAQNIANANTPGYSRQEAILGSKRPDQLGTISLGTGVQVTEIRRLVDPILAKSQLANSGQTELAETIQQGLASIESSFGSLGAPGLTSTLDAFFTSLQLLANTPADSIVRADVLSKAQTLTTQVTDMRQQLSDRQLASDQEINPLLTKANTLLTQIGDLNSRIAAAELGQTAFKANDLRDQRDSKITDLAQLIAVRKIDTNNGSLMLQTPGGDLLVQDNVVRQLQRGSTGSSGYAQISFTDNSQVASGLTQSGQIGGLITLRDDKLKGYITQLDSLAANLAFSINQQQVNGTGTSSVSSYTSGQAATNAAGTATAVNLDANVPFASQIKTGTFKIYVLKADGSAVNTSPGKTITVTAGTTTLAAIATALNAVNGVTASVSSGKLTVKTDSSVTAAKRIVFGNDTSNFLAAYEVNAFLHSGTTAAVFSVDSAIAADANSIASAVATVPTDPAKSLVAISDNTAALGLLGVRDKTASVDGTTAASPISRAASLISTFGLDVASANQDVSFRTAESNALENQRQVISGVNIDEELANMLRFQRSYEAAAKVIQVSNTMLGALLGLIR